MPVFDWNPTQENNMPRQALMSPFIAEPCVRTARKVIPKSIVANISGDLSCIIRGITKGIIKNAKTTEMEPPNMEAVRPAPMARAP